MRFQIVPLLLLIFLLTACSAPVLQPSGFNLEKLLIDVFDPQPGEKVLVIVDHPHGGLADTNIAVALTEFSATASLIKFTERFPRLRAASTPMVTRSMEQTALAADYREVARKSHILADRLDRVVGAEIEFSAGHQLYVDLRNRHAEVDDGRLYANKEGMRVINLLSGEAYIAPYEGELPGQPSRTAGMIPYTLVARPSKKSDVCTIWT